MGKEGEKEEKNSGGGVGGLIASFLQVIPTLEIVLYLQVVGSDKDQMIPF